MAEEKFEEALKKLEDTVREMESGDLTLEESLKSFEEGIRLSRFCAKKLDEAERRIEVLLKNEEGLDIQPFKGEDKSDP
ncbi:MAG: exodeoxyribonuclease VII small subunit [Syntrophales bacterium]|nr:exodeoxyribonuclease VII small subunit [Syntrophales bacterium]